jgi:tetratricopeptide (TPR) repeat protein
MAQKPASPAAPEVPAWKKALYAPERVAKFVKGEMTLQELHGITGPEMLEMAVTGYTMYEQGQYKQAKVIFDGLASLDPKEAYYRTALGAVHLAEGNLDEALRVLDEAVKLDGKDLAAFVNRGEAYLRKGDIIKAAQDFKKAITLDPTGKDPLTRRAKALSAAVLKSLETAPAPSKNEAANKSKPAAAAPAKGKPTQKR